MAGRCLCGLGFSETFVSTLFTCVILNGIVAIFQSSTTNFDTGSNYKRGSRNLWILLCNFKLAELLLRLYLEHVQLQAS